MRLFPLLFIVLPILEMWLLIEVGGEIGAFNTVVLVLLTAMIGFALLRQQGIATLQRAQQRMAQGQMPAKEMAEGICLAVGGALLLTPGFITDCFGFFCLIPGLRQLLLGGLLANMQTRGAAHGQFDGHYQGGQTFDQQAPPSANRPDVIEGEFKKDD